MVGCIFVSFFTTLTCLWISTRKISYKIKYIYLQNRVYNSVWKYLHFLRFLDMNLKKSAISQACPWHSPFIGCMFDGWDYIQYISVQITHCKQPLSTSRWFSRKEECSIVTVLSSIMNLQQKSWAVQIKIQFSVSIAWTSILIHTTQANYSDLSQGHPKWIPAPAKSRKKDQL